MHNKFFSGKWFNRCHFFINEKKFKKVGVTGELLSAYSST